MGEGVWVSATKADAMQSRQEHSHGNAHAFIHVVIGLGSAVFLGVMHLFEDDNQSRCLFNERLDVIGAKGFEVFQPF